MRDRRGPLAALLLLAAYGAALLWSQLWLAEALGAPIQARLDPTLITLLTINGWLLAWRILMRAGFTASAYGWREGLLSIPRLVVGNVIAMLAAARAVSLASRRRREALGQDPPHLPRRASAMRPSLRFLGLAVIGWAGCSRGDPGRASRRRDLPDRAAAKPRRRRSSRPNSRRSSRSPPAAPIDASVDFAPGRPCVDARRRSRPIAVPVYYRGVVRSAAARHRAGSQSAPAADAARRNSIRRSRRSTIGRCRASRRRRCRRLARPSSCPAQSVPARFSQAARPPAADRLGAAAQAAGRDRRLAIAGERRHARRQARPGRG